MNEALNNERKTGSRLHNVCFDSRITMSRSGNAFAPAVVDSLPDFPTCAGLRTGIIMMMMAVEIMMFHPTMFTRALTVTQSSNSRKRIAKTKLTTNSLQSEMDTMTTVLKRSPHARNGSSKN